jgi:uncharacterized protein
MPELWIDVSDLPEEGREYELADREQWAAWFRDYDVPGEPGDGLAAEVRVQAEGEGFLVSGAVSGPVHLPCDRCAEPFEYRVDAAFGEYEPAEDEAREDGGESRAKTDRGRRMLNVGASVWEQLVMALPPKPLCGEDCAGLCAQCGCNRNSRDCDCGREDGDSRLAVLRNLKLS